MSFPNMMFGPDGTEKKISTAAQAQLGQLLVLGDGRKYRYAKNSSAAAMDAGVLAQSAAPISTAHLTTLSISAAAVGQRYVELSSALATAVSTGAFTDGFLIVQNTTAVAGAGRLYGIESLELTSAVSTNRVNLKKGLDVALTSSAEVTLHKNPFRDVIIHPSPPTQKVLGWSQSTISTGGYGWFCVSGLTAAMFDAPAPAIGRGVVPSTALDGAVVQNYMRFEVGTTAGTTQNFTGSEVLNSLGAESAGTIHGLTTATANDLGWVQPEVGIAYTSGVTSAEFGVVWATLES